MQDFKPFFVKCIKAKGISFDYNLVEDQIYQVSEINATGSYRLVGKTMTGYDCNRFVLVNDSNTTGQNPPAPTPVAADKPINNHECNTCHNTKVNILEKTCWLCGNPLS